MKEEKGITGSEQPREICEFNRGRTGLVKASGKNSRTAPKLRRKSRDWREGRLVSGSSIRQKGASEGRAFRKRKVARPGKLLRRRQPAKKRVHRWGESPT